MLIEKNGKNGRLMVLDSEKHHYLLNDWTIEVELNNDKESTLSIFNNKAETGIYYNCNEGSYKQSTVIKYNGNKKELIDILPDSMK